MKISTDIDKESVFFAISDIMAFIMLPMAIFINIKLGLGENSIGLLHTGIFRVYISLIAIWFAGHFFHRAYIFCLAMHMLFKSMTNKESKDEKNN